MAPKEIYSDWSISYDSAKDLTRQLDYYNIKNVSTSNYSGTIKKLETTARRWWLRSAVSNDYQCFFHVSFDGSWWFNTAINNDGISPAFRIG